MLPACIHISHGSPRLSCFPRLSPTGLYAVCLLCETKNARGMEANEGGTRWHQFLNTFTSTTFRTENHSIHQKQKYAAATSERFRQSKRRLLQFRTTLLAYKKYAIMWRKQVAHVFEACDMVGPPHTLHNAFHEPFLRPKASRKRTCLVPGRMASRQACSAKAIAPLNGLPWHTAPAEGGSEGTKQSRARKGAKHWEALNKDTGSCRGQRPVSSQCSPTAKGG